MGKSHRISNDDVKKTMRNIFGSVPNIQICWNCHHVKWTWIQFESSCGAAVYTHQKKTMCHQKLLMILWIIWTQAVFSMISVSKILIRLKSRIKLLYSVHTLVIANILHKLFYGSTQELNWYGLLNDANNDIYIYINW